jgi:uncharacterized UBP type Zn finger protein
MCDHLEGLRTRKRPVRPGTLGCAECLAAGGTWVHLRLCLSCGHVGCCDDSPNRHATRHFRDTGHPVVRSFEPGETWAWCYADEELAEDLPTFPQETPARHYGPGEAHARSPR